jgi:hypothetical protein
LADLVNATGNIGDGLEASASNYDTANQASNVAGGRSPVPFPKPTAPIQPTYPPSPEGGGGQPFLWKAIQSIIGMAWPNGDSGKLRAAAAAWRAMSGDCHGAGAALKGQSGVADGQRIAEAESIDDAFATAMRACGKAGDLCAGIASKLDQCATHLDNVHHALSDLLRRVSSPSAILGEVVDLFGGDTSDLHAIAHDAKTALGNFNDEVSAVGELLGSYIEEAWELSRSLASILSMILEQVVVKPVYNTLVPIVNDVASFGNYIAQHPLAAGELVGGAMVTAAGAVMEAGGAGLDVTGVLSPAGIAVNAAGIPVIGAGIGAMTAGIHQLDGDRDNSDVHPLSPIEDEPTGPAREDNTPGGRG